MQQAWSSFGWADSQKSDERGFALIAVLIASVVITGLALFLISYARIAAETRNTFIAETETRSWTEAGLVRILLAYTRRGDTLRIDLRPDSSLVVWHFHNHDLLLRAQAESGKLDLNAADRIHIVNVLARLIASNDLRASILAKIDSARQNGPKLSSVAEVLPPLERMNHFRDVLERYFTVFTDQIGVDLTTASPLIIKTIPGISSQLSAEILASRNNGSAIRLSAEIGRHFVSQRPIYTFRAETHTGFRQRGAMRAIVKFEDYGPPSILRWERVGQGAVSGEDLEPYRPF